MQTAYWVRDFQIIGGPDWIGTDRFDVVVNTGQRVTLEKWGSVLKPALETLLREKFQLKFHRETKDLPVDALTVSPRGLRMEPSHVQNCSSFRVDRGRPRSWDSPDYCGAFEGGPNLQLNHTLDARGMDIAALAKFLGMNLDRIVIDRTGLSGRYGFHLEWNRGATTDKTSESADAPSLFTALDDQLGLRLQPATGPVEVLQVDHAERPR